MTRSRRAALTSVVAAGGLAGLAPSAFASVTVSDVRVDETDAPTSVTFTITRTPERLALPERVLYTTADATATAPADYAVTRGQVDFPAAVLGEPQAQQVTVPIAGDDVHEGDETFLLRISATQEVADPEAVATIADDDPAAPGAPAPGPAPAAPNAPAVFGLGAPRLERPATIRVSTACPRASQSCRGSVSVRTRPVRRSKLAQLRRARTLGKRRFTLAGGRSRTIRLRLRRADLALLRRAGRMSVQATSRVTDAAGRTTRRTVRGSLIARTAHSD